jgi:putative endonuclease
MDMLENYGIVAANIQTVILTLGKGNRAYMWFIYIVKCSDQSLYTGITTDLDRRVTEHNESPKGAKYTRARRPVNLVYSESVKSKSEAAKREYEIKQMTRAQKLSLIKPYA